MTRRKAQRGQAMLILAFALPLLLGMVGLAFDVGFLAMMQRTAQTAADAGAIAGAVDLPYGQMTTSAKAATAVNGFNDGTNGVSVTVNNPPSLGPHNGSCSTTPANCNYVEVVVSQPEPTFFLRMIGAPATTTVAARAVAYNTAGDCIFALNSSISGALTLGTGLLSLVEIDTPNCAIIVDSTSSSALKTGGVFVFATINSRQTGIVGNYSCPIIPCTFNPAAVTGIAPESDPLAYLTPPTTVACTGTLKTITTSQTISGGSGASCYNYNITGSPTVTFNPGSYAAITINGTANVTFNPGLYTLWGTGASSQCFNSYSTCSLGISGVLSTIKGNGVTFYFGPSAGSVEVSGFINTMNLTPPTTGVLPGSLGAGVLFYQDRTNPKQACIGGCGGSVSGLFNFVQVQGALYFPAAGVDFEGCCQYNTGNAYYTAYEILVADHMTLSWDWFNDDYSSLPGGSPVKRTLLAE